MPSSNEALGSCKQVAGLLEGLYVVSGAHSQLHCRWGKQQVCREAPPLILADDSGLTPMHGVKKPIWWERGLLGGTVSHIWAACTGLTVHDRLGTTWRGKGSCRSVRPPFLQM